MSSPAPGSGRTRKTQKNGGRSKGRKRIRSAIWKQKKNNRWRKGIKEEKGQREQEEEIEASSGAINRSFSRK